MRAQNRLYKPQEKRYPEDHDYYGKKAAKASFQNDISETGGCQRCDCEIHRINEIGNLFIFGHLGLENEFRHDKDE